MQGDGVDINVVNDSAAPEDSGIAHADLLCAIVDAVVKGSDAQVIKAHAAIIDTLGFEALVDSAAVIGNFERMNRIADATGIALDSPTRAASSDIHDHWASASSPAQPIRSQPVES
ncbi:MAG: hypothetical protein VCD00_17490 [Candidatus Hydrogenedentota bacterium]